MTNEPKEEKRPMAEPQPERPSPEREAPDYPRRGSETSAPRREKKGANPNDIFPIEEER